LVAAPVDIHPLVWILPLAGGLLLAGLAAAFTRMRLPRSPEKEGEQDTEAVGAYSLASNSLPFKVVRYLMIREVKRCRPEGTLLDAGCGPGQLARLIGRKFPHLEVAGLDLNSDMVAVASKNGAGPPARNVDFYLGDVLFLPCRDGCLDLVVSTLSLHHWQDPARGLEEILRALKPGGSLLLMDLRRDCRRWFYYTLALIQRFAVSAPIRRTNGAVGSMCSSYTPDELARLLHAARFDGISISLAPGWMLARARKAAGAPAGDGASRPARQALR
jgi:ubiquinone/menaquinone biosynthesis C-methylase UbiE